MYELARVGVPTIAVAIIENQLNNINGWNEAGFIEYAGWWDDDALPARLALSMAKLADEKIRLWMSRIGRSYRADRSNRECRRNW